MNQASLALVGAKVFSGGKIHTGLAVVMEGRRIQEVVQADRLPKEIARQRLDGGVLTPGFIDIQVNGGGGVLLNNEPTPDGVRKIGRAHRRFGTTGLLPTVITDTPEVIAQAVESVCHVREAGEAAVLGIHIEGPFIDSKRKGAHDERHIRSMTEADIGELTRRRSGVTLITLAPNRVSPDLITKLTQAGVIVSLGHSDASAEQALAAIHAGARNFTHLFNAMSQLEGRAPGMAGAALADEQSYFSVIADGHHVSDVALRVAFRAKNLSRAVLITDAMSSAAGGPDEFLLQGRKVRRRNGRLELEGGTLAGSDLTMDQAVRHCVMRLGLPLENVLAMASTNPAMLLGLEHELGEILPGHLANLVHLSDDLEVKGTWIEGASTPN
jgi:N-acetylglucosamine-6-phosphate deacetylase